MTSIYTSLLLRLRLNLATGAILVVLLGYRSLLLSAPCQAAEIKNGPLQVTLTPISATFRIGEPIVVRVDIQNTGDQDLRVYRRDSLSFAAVSCDDPDSRDLRPVQDFTSFSLRAELLPKAQRIEGWAILNRDLQFTRPKTYTVKVPISFYTPDIQQGADFSFEVFSAQIVIEPGPLRSSILDPYLSAAQDSRLAFEMLLWSDDARALPRIVEVAGNFENDLPQVFRDLARRLPDEQTMNAVKTLAKRGLPLILVATSVIEGRGLSVPRKTLLEWLSGMTREDVVHFARILAEYHSRNYGEIFSELRGSDDDALRAAAELYFEAERALP